MKTVHLIVREIVHRKLNFLLSFIAVVTAVALYVFFHTTGAASERETARVMRDLGFNLRIVARDTDMAKFWATGRSDRLMAEESVQRFASQPGLSYNHLLATLTRNVDWQGTEVILTGISSEVIPPGKKKSPMIFSITPGEIHVGDEIARSLNLARGDTVELAGLTFTVAACLSPSGTRDDITVYAHLSDVQKATGLNGMINEIRALECLCRDPDLDSIEVLEEQLGRLLPGARVIQIRDMAKARERQRHMTEKYFASALPIVLAVCAAWIGLLAWMNVRERRREIGTLRALGYGSGSISMLFMGKAVLTGLIGAVAGYGAGMALSLWLGPGIFEVTAAGIKPTLGLFLESTLLAPAFAALAAFLPALSAVAQDPAEVLRDE